MPYKTKKVGSKYCVYKKDGGKKVGCTKGTQEAKKKYLAALHVNESFKFFFESKDADIEDLKNMIKNPDPSKVKEYGGTEYVDMLKKKLARLEEDEQAKVRKGGAGQAFYTGTRVEKDKKKKQSKKQARGKVRDEDAEIDAADGAMKGIIAKERLNYIDNIMSTYKGKSLDFYKKALDKSSHFKDGRLTPYELFTIKREMKRHNDAEHDEDAEDRCKRKADSVYGKKTSAYKSGAIVRCRDGKIWKK